MVTVDVFFNIRAGFMFRYNPSGSSHHFLHVRTACGLSSNGKTNDAMGPNLLGHFFSPNNVPQNVPNICPAFQFFHPRGARHGLLAALGRGRAAPEGG